MAKSVEYLLLLQAWIEQEHQCDAVHRESVHVHETVDGRTIWKGDVEVFDLIGHVGAKGCFAWWYDDGSKGVQVVTVLERAPVTSAAMAVKSAVFFDAQPAPYPRRDSSSTGSTTQSHTE
jgi:hypothetical protein